MYKVFIGSPVRDRGWILQNHINSLIKQKGISQEYCYVLNNSTDNTEDILKKNSMNYVTYDIKSPTSRADRRMYSKDHLSELRNYFIEKFLESDCDYLFSVDTDVMLIGNSDILKLIEDDRDIISILINNSPICYAHNILIGGKRPKGIQDMIMPVDVTGAVYLIKRHVIESGVRYGFDPIGEDVIFCQQARDKGFGIYCDTRIHAVHAYNKNQYLLPWTVQGRQDYKGVEW